MWRRGSSRRSQTRPQGWSRTLLGSRSPRPERAGEGSSALNLAESDCWGVWEPERGQTITEGHQATGGWRAFAAGSSQEEISAWEVDGSKRGRGVKCRAESSVKVVFQQRWNDTQRVVTLPGEPLASGQHLDGQAALLSMDHIKHGHRPSAEHCLNHTMDFWAVISRPELLIQLQLKHQCSVLGCCFKSIYYLVTQIYEDFLSTGKDTVPWLHQWNLQCSDF